MTDARVTAIRNDPFVGSGSCTMVDECMEDREIVADLDREGVATAAAAVTWAREAEGIYLERGTNASSGEPDCPLIAAYNEWEF